jgi:hypothetical protein
MTKVSRMTRLLTASLIVLAAAGAATAQDRNVRYTLYGTPGLIEMPTAMSAPDSEIAAQVSITGFSHRVNLSFQVTPRLSGTFRYSGVDDFDGPGTGQFYDRSFDLRYRLTDEGDYLPAIAVGLQDFLGTSLYSSEYLVATKTFGDSVRVSAGIGWGRLGTYNGFDNPLGYLSDYFDERPDGFGAGTTGGMVEFDRFFRGPAAFFGGVEYAITDAWMIKAEYSSDDAYTDRRGNPLIDRRTPFNLGLSWRPRPGYQVDLAYLYGSEIALAGTILLNPNERPFLSGLDSAPPPVALRPADLAAAASWDQALAADGPESARIGAALAAEGIDLNGIAITGTTATVRYTNDRYRTESQAMGRVARILSAELPVGVETITFEPMQRGLALSGVTLSRTDIERLENTSGGAEALFQAADFGPAGNGTGLTPGPVNDNPFRWGLTPYLALLVFDGDNPVRADYGLHLAAEYEFAPNLIASGRLRYSLAGFDDPGPISPSTLPPVRRNIGFYNVEGNPGIEYLQLAWYGRPAENLYSRVNVGYLETMFAGVSAELLWKPVDSRLAFGAEVSQVWQRDFDMLFGLQDYSTTTAHLSAYYDFQNGWHGQLDVGQYLAGDVGATITIDREFENGWRLGGYATFTNVSAEDFGEGSFDKGIRLQIPFDYLLGQPSRRDIANNLASLTRDGGARLNIQGRLYDTVRDGHLANLDDSWGRFWR